MSASCGWTQPEPSPLECMQKSCKSSTQGVEGGKQQVTPTWSMRGMTPTVEMVTALRRRLKPCELPVIILAAAETAG